MASVRFTGTSTPSSFSVAIQLSSRVFGSSGRSSRRRLPADVLPVIAARRPITRRLVSRLRRGVGGEHRDAFHAQRPAVDRVVEVALHGDELPVADGGHHPASARAEVARGRELADLGELHRPGRRPRRRDIHQTGEGQATSAAETEPEEVSPADPRRVARCAVRGCPGDPVCGRIERLTHDATPVQGTPASGPGDERPTLPIRGGHLATTRPCDLGLTPAGQAFRSHTSALQEA